MVTLDIKNSTIADLSSQSDLIPKYLEKIYQRNQGFYKIVDDEKPVEEILEYVKSVEGEFDNIVVLGIGGSSLGTICLQQSLKHLFKNPKLHVLDNIDPKLITQIEDVIDYPKTLFIAVSKSGGTPETLSQYFYFRNKCNEKGLDAKKHFVFITGPEKGILRKTSNEEGIRAFGIPENVGGRFSVLTSVGLLPAALIGIDIKKLLQGARDMRDRFYSDDIEKNLPFQIAAIQYLLGVEGKSMTVIMPYSQNLIRFADWYRQLLAESIGKAKNDKGDSKCRADSY